MSAPAPLVFIYDRCATRNHRHLDMRLQGCHDYADRMGWVLAGCDSSTTAAGAQAPVGRR